MFWNKKKKEESEEDLYDITDELDGEEETESAAEDADEDFDGADYGDEDCSEDLDNGDTDAEDGEEYESEEYDLEGEDSEDGAEDGQDGGNAVTVSARVGSLNSLAEFISMRHPLDLQFMRKDSDEVFELRESHFRLARVFGSVSMYRECSAEEYAKITLAMELLENPDAFHVLPALTESDMKAAMTDFCEEKYGEKSKKYARNPKKFAKLIEENGDKDEWKLLLKERLYNKTEDFCIENGITFSEEDGDEGDE